MAEIDAEKVKKHKWLCVEFDRLSINIFYFGIALSLLQDTFIKALLWMDLMCLIA